MGWDVGGEGRSINKYIQAQIFISELAVVLEKECV